jgi:hypothetical protein
MTWYPEILNKQAHITDITFVLVLKTYVYNYAIFNL